MRKNVLIVMVIAIGFLLFACSNTEEVPAEGEMHKCAQSGGDIPAGEGIMKMKGEENVR